MTGGYALPDRLVPFPDESMAGLAMRYAALYGFATPEHLFHRLGAGRSPLPALVARDPDSPGGAAVARLLNLAPDEASRLSTWHPERCAVGLCGHRVNADLAGLYVRAACPACLRDSPHHRAAWLIAAIPACPLHATFLLRDCPRCGARLAWRGAGPHLCPDAGCGFDLRDAAAAALAPGAADAAAGLRQLFGGGSHPSGLGFIGALRAALELGRIRLGLPQRTRLAGLVEGRRADLPAILAAGWQELTPWPDAFHRLLEAKLQAAPGNAIPYGFSAAFGPLGGLTHVKRHSWAGPLVSEMAAFAAGRADMALRGDVARRRSAGRGDGGRHLSASEAAGILGVSVDTMLRTAARLGLHAATVGAGEQRLLKGDEVRRLAAAQAAEDRDGALTAKAAASALAVSRPTLAAMARRNVLAEIPSGSRVMKRMSFRRADVAALLARFEAAAADAPRVARPCGGHRLVGGGGKDGWGTVRICEAVLAGEARPIAVWEGGPGLRRYLFPRSFAAAGAVGLRPRRSDAPGRCP